MQPGVRNLAISQAVEHLGLYYAPDPSSQIACTIGGNVAENSGGVHCLKYGLTVHNILALEIVTMDGERLTIGGGSLDAPGYDLLALLTGSEGMLGVIVEVTVRLLPRPASASLLLAAFDDVERAGGAVAAIIAAGIVPGGLEMMDNLALRAAEGFVHAGYPVEAAALLLCELDGTAEEVAEQSRRVEALLREGGAQQVRVARDERERALFWSGRKAAFPAVGRISPDYYCMDGTIPRAQLGRVLRRIGELSAEHGLAVANVFHAGDGNLHPLILYDAAQPGELQRAESFGARILELCVDVRRHHHRRARRGRGEDRPDVRAVPRAGTGAVPRREGRLRSRRPAEPGQGGAHAGALRGVRAHARARGRTRAPRAGALLSMAADRDCSAEIAARVAAACA